MADPADAQKTVILDDRHRAFGGRMVPFAGYELPVQYPTGIVAEHVWTRTHAGLFDVSHMGPAFLTLDRPTGDAVADHAALAAVIEPLVCGDVLGLASGRLRYTLLLADSGGIRDDLMVAHAPGGGLYIVVNAGTKDADFAHIAAAAAGRATLRRADDRALLALQGPEAVAVLAMLVPDAAALGFMRCGEFAWNGAALLISRSGYTGEDGFEILVAAEHAGRLFDTLLADPRTRPIGLGARDSLRLEAGLPLYGHDLDDTVTPVEAGLTFAISKRRREAADFPGAPRILNEIANGPRRRRVGIRFTGRLPVREGAPLLDAAGATIGRITSGGFAPTLEAPIALGFLPPDAAAEGTAVTALVRDRAVTGTVVKLPFVPHRYVRKAIA